MRLTLISITFKGKRYSKFAMMRYNKQGQVVIGYKGYDTFASEIGIRKGQTYIPS